MPNYRILCSRCFIYTRYPNNLSQGAYFVVFCFVYMIIPISPVGLYSLRRTRLIGIGIPMINMRRSSDRLRFIMRIPIPVRGGWGCEVSWGGHHRPRGKTTTGSALDGSVFDIAQILAYLVHNMSRSQLYVGFGHFAWLPSFFGQ